MFSCLLPQTNRLKTTQLRIPRERLHKSVWMGEKKCVGPLMLFTKLRQMFTISFLNSVPQQVEVNVESLRGVKTRLNPCVHVITLSCLKRENPSEFCSAGTFAKTNTRSLQSLNRKRPQRITQNPCVRPQSELFQERWSR